MDHVPADDQNDLNSHLDTLNSATGRHRESIPDTLFSHSDTTHNITTTIKADDRPTQLSASAPPHKALFNVSDNSMELQDLKKPDDIVVTGTSDPGPTTLLVPNFVPEASEGYMNSLPPPPPYDLKIDDLTIGVPHAASNLPIPLPDFVDKLLAKKPGEEGGKTIVRNVSASCASGEMLAM